MLFVPAIEAILEYAPKAIISLPWLPEILQPVNFISSLLSEASLPAMLFVAPDK